MLFGIFRDRTKKGLQSVPQRHRVAEPFSGAWQRNRELNREELTAFFAVFACVSKIAQDAAKMRFLTKRESNGIMQAVRLPRFAVLDKPNRHQTMQQMMECWMQSKLLRGNAYILKQRNVEGKITELYVLNPDRVQPLVDDDGSVYYQIGRDRLSGQGEETLILPADEIIHDRWNCLYHPLVGISPIAACAVASGNGIAIQENSNAFFANQSRPSGILTAPGHITQETAEELRARWNAAYGGANSGKTAVLGDDMKYQPISLSAADSQLIDQLRLSAEIVCSTFKVPPFLIGFGSLPAGMKVSDINELYYSSCLQSMLEAVENLLTDALAGNGIEIEFDLDALIRMDAFTQIEVLKAGVGSALITPNEGRAKLGLSAVDGGDSPYLQQQNFSLAALAKRDAREDPFDNTRRQHNDSEP